VTQFNADYVNYQTCSTWYLYLYFHPKYLYFLLEVLDTNLKVAFVFSTSGCLRSSFDVVLWDIRKGKSANLQSFLPDIWGTDG